MTPKSSKADQAAGAKDPAFLTVAIGCSAGGLEAMTPLLEALPPDPGLAFIILQHRLPNHESQMIEILARHTHLPVLEAVDGARIEANRIYVVPGKREMLVSAGRLAT